MTEFTDGTAKGKTLSLQEVYKNIDTINQDIKTINTGINNLKNEKSGLLMVTTFSASGTNASPCAILTASEQSEYQFLCWVMIWTDGGVVPVHANHPEKSSTQIWSTDNSMVAGLTIRGMALYVKKG